jgi:predicted nucleic acid-binding protein
VSVIIDTCVWSRFLRRDRAPLDAVAGEVADLVRADAVQLLGPIRQELLSGAHPAERFAQLREYLRFFPNLPLDEEDDETAAGLYNLLRQRGLQGTGTDLLICAAAIRRGMKIFTTDGDFESFVKHIPIKLYQFRGKL